MSSVFKVKVVSKPVTSTRHHLATFDHKLSPNTVLPKHVIQEVVSRVVEPPSN